MSYNNDTTSHPEKQVNLVQIAQEVVHNLLQSYDPTPLPPDADGLFHYIYITWRRDTYKFYVGKHSSKNPATDNYIGSGKHMLNAIEKHGASSFEHRILQYTTTAQEALDLEATIVNEGYIRRYRDELRISYNLIGGGWGQGVVSEETRQKMSEVQKKRYENPEVRIKQSENTKKYFDENPEAREKANNTLKEYRARPEARIKFGEAHKKRFENNPEAREKVSENLKKYYSENPEAIQKMSEARKKYFEDNSEARIKNGEYMKQYYKDNPEAKERAREKSLQQFAVRELTDLSGTTKIKVNKDEVLQYLKQGWYLNNTSVALYNPTTLQKVDVYMRQKGKDYRVTTTPRIIKLLEEGWVLGTAPKN